MDIEARSGTTAPLRHSPSSTSLRPSPTSARGQLPSAKCVNIPPTTAPAPPEVITSLINSLSAISEPVEEHFDNLPAINDSKESQEANLAAQASRQSLGSSLWAPSRGLAQKQPQQHGWGMDYNAYKRRDYVVTESDLEEDAAPSPPVRMAKAPTRTTSKSMSKHSSSSLLESRTSQTSLSARQSQQDLRGNGDVASIGIPSVERLHHSSTTSIASSADIAQRGSQRHKKPREIVLESVNATNVDEEVGRSGNGLLRGAAKFLRPVRSRQSLKNGNTSTSRSASPQPSTLRTGTSQSSGFSATNTANPINPGSPHSTTSQGTLNGHLIPSRRSSLRYSANESARENEQGRPSVSLEDMAIDQTLIEEDHSTVKRIRELQEARERRQREWRKESTKSNKTKRKSLPGSKSLRRTNSPQSSHMSIAEESSPLHGAAEENSASALAPQGGLNGPKSQDRASDSSAVLLTPPRKSSKRHDLVSQDPGSLACAGSSISPAKRPPAATNGAPDLSMVHNNGTTEGGGIDAEVEAFLNSPRLTQTIRHPQSGRIIAFSEVGDPAGFAVICCVGMGLTRYLTAFYHELARTLKLRLITLDRPGIGESDPGLNAAGMPLSWPDDVELICDHLGVVKFSLLAHSAGALYALATALRMPQRIRGRVHLLAPWITPSQMAAPGLLTEPSPAANIPFSQKVLSILPASFLKAANASFFNAASISVAKSDKPSALRRSLVPARPKSAASQTSEASVASPPTNQSVSYHEATNNTLHPKGTIPPRTSMKGAASITHQTVNDIQSPVSAQQHRAAYDAALTPRIWSLATTDANPAVDLIICLEKHTPIGFLYTDITRPVVIHHGSRDTRVPVENVRWLAKRMKRCELRELEGEGHGLMANANVMAGILGEISREWDEWARLVKGKKGRRRGIRPNEYAGQLAELDQNGGAE